MSTTAALVDVVFLWDVVVVSPAIVGGSPGENSILVVG
jgi:hypothetical protein